MFITRDNTCIISTGGFLPQKVPFVVTRMTQKKKKFTNISYFFFPSLTYLSKLCEKKSEIPNLLQESTNHQK